MSNLNVFVILCVISVVSSTSANPNPEEKDKSIKKPDIGKECICANTLEYLPVCASNGRTYANKGEVRCENKCKRLHLRILHQGQCRKHHPYKEE